MNEHPLISVVVPVRNEAPNLRPLVEEIASALVGLDFEIVYVDDGSTDATSFELATLATEFPLRFLRHQQGFGQSAAIITGVQAARGRWIATLDGDGQNDPADIPSLLAHAQAVQGPVLIAGHRIHRRDNWRKRLTSRIANKIRAAVLGDHTPDTGCGLKLFEREVFLSLPHFDHMHRYLPALFLRAGAKVISAPVHHRPRARGVSNYGTLDRLLVGIPDLCGVWWLMRRGKRPQIEP
jgi:dolichol-phosphate mannosyltransferase